MRAYTTTAARIAARPRANSPTIVISRAGTEGAGPSGDARAVEVAMTASSRRASAVPVAAAAVSTSGGTVTEPAVVEGGTVAVTVPASVGGARVLVADTVLVAVALGVRVAVPGVTGVDVGPGV